MLLSNVCMLAYSGEKPKAAFFCNPSSIRGVSRLDSVFGKGRRGRIAELADLYPVVVTGSTFEAHVDKLRDLAAIISTWGMPALTAEQIGRLPHLRAVFYAAGSVKHFARPFLEAGITVVSAWAANAVPVAEFVLAQILLSGKGYFRNTRECRLPAPARTQAPFVGRGNYGETIALIGAGQIGRRLVGLLKPFNMSILVVDPYLADAEADALGVRKATLQQAFQEGCVVSNHLPNLPTLQKVLHGGLFASMRPDATFINTGRGAQVNEADLIAVLKQRPDLTALLDVTDPEPPAPDSELYRLPNVQLSSHIAGSVNDETLRMADFIIEEFIRWRNGAPLRFAVSLDMLETMA